MPDPCLPRLLPSLAIGGALLIGCASPQDFALLDPSTPDASLRQSKVVVEGHTVGSHSRYRPTWYETLFPFLPILNAPGGSIHDLEIDVDRVVAGQETNATLQIRDIREFTEQEQDLLPPPHDVMNHFIGGVRIRLGYDKRSGNSYRNLKIVPLGNTPEMEADIQAAKAQGRHIATRPARKR